MANKLKTIAGLVLLAFIVVRGFQLMDAFYQAMTPTVHGVSDRVIATKNIKPQ